MDRMKSKVHAVGTINRMKSKVHAVGTIIMFLHLGFVPPSHRYILVSVMSIC